MSSPQKRHYRYHGITASHLPSPWYYREIFPVSAIITMVTAVLPLSPLPGYPLIYISELKVAFSCQVDDLVVPIWPYHCVNYRVHLVA